MQILQRRPARQEGVKMQIKISEVWNESGKSEQLTVIEPTENPYLAVTGWIEKNRPDLRLASGLFDHGYHAVEI